MIIDAIVVLSGGRQQNDNINSLPNYVKDRLDKCVEIFNENKQIPYIIVSSAGTPHRPPFVNSNNKTILECDSMVKYLCEKHNIDSSMILREYMSYDTIGNAYFTKTNFIDKLNIKKFCVITSQFHMERTQVIFNFIFNKIIPNKSFVKKYEMKYYINFVSTQTKVDQEKLNLRLIKENKSIIDFIDKIYKFNLSNDLNLFKFMHFEHKCYNTFISLNNKKESININNQLY